MPATTASQRIFIASLAESVGREVVLRGWVYRLRVLGKTTFVVLKDCSGETQCVAASESLREFHLKSDDSI
jgi:nondiscriminating aspartyl-tRNA synthetase